MCVSTNPDKVDDELEMTMVCHRPEGLEQLEAQTNFNKRELQVLYRGFKNVGHTIFFWLCLFVFFSCPVQLHLSTTHALSKQLS